MHPTMGASREQVTDTVRTESGHFRMIPREAVERARELRGAGWSYERIAEQIEVSERTVRRWLVERPKQLAARTEASLPENRHPDPLPADLLWVRNADWSIGGLEALGVPVGEAPRLLGLYAQLEDHLVIAGARLDAEGRLQRFVSPWTVELLTEVRLYAQHPGIPPEEARKIAGLYASALRDDDRTALAGLEGLERFETWKSKEHGRAYDRYRRRRS